MKDVITEKLICLDMQAKTKEETIQQLAKLLYAEKRINNLQGYIDSVMLREEMTSTGIGFGIAIPHGKSLDVKETSIAFASVKGGIEWDSLDHQPVYAVILLAIPESDSGEEHLRLLATISRKLMHEEFRETLQHCQDAKQLSTLLNTCL